MSALTKSDRSSETAKIPASGGRRGVWGLFAVAAVFAVLLSAVAVPSALAHPPEAKTVCPDGYTLSADETECSKTTAQDHGKASCDAGYNLVPKTRGAAVCEKNIGSPVCLSGFIRGSECIGELSNKPVCLSGFIRGSECIGELSNKPVCLSGFIRGSECIGELSNKPVCSSGFIRGSECIGELSNKPVCSSGTLQAGACVTTTTTTASYRCGSGRLTTGAFGIPVCEHFRVAQCPAGYSVFWGGCVKANPPSTADKICPSGYSKRGGFCYRYTVATPYCTSGTLSGHSCKRTTKVGDPTCLNGSRQDSICVGKVGDEPPRVLCRLFCLCVGLAAWVLLTIVVGLVLGRRDAADAVVQAAAVEPVDPFQGGELEVVEAAPGAFVAD